MISTRSAAIVLLIFSLPLTGCGSVDDSAVPSPMAIPLTPTATVAFPTLIPTSTFTPNPTSSPTPDIPSNPGSIVFNDPFSNTLLWIPAELAPGGLSLSEERLFISVRQSNSIYMAISPVDSLVNAFVEADVRPELCSGNDEFGLIFRVNDDFDHYRFTLTCEGEARVVGVVDGVERVLVQNTSSTTIFPGLFLSNHLGVLMENEQFRFYINGEEVFSDRDLSLTAGRVGLLVRARQSGQTTASFDNFTIRVVQPFPTSTASD